MKIPPNAEQLIKARSFALVAALEGITPHCRVPRRWKYLQDSWSVPPSSRRPERWHNLALVRQWLDLDAAEQWIADRRAGLAKHIADTLPTERQESAVAAAGFTVNEKKTRLCDARFGRPTVTGIALCPDGTIAPTRRAARRAKSAAHDAKTKPTPRRKRIARGCAEWCELRQPNPAKMSQCELSGALELMTAI